MKRSGARRGSHGGAALAVVLTALLSANLAHADVEKERFKGTCEQLNDFIARAGVTDARSQNHPRSAGWTTFEVTSAPYQLTYKPEKKEGEVCLETTLTGIPKMFSVTPRVTRLDWQPFGSISKECLAEKARWEKATEEREREQMKAVGEVVDRQNRAWSAAPHRYRACAASEPLARADLGQQVERDIKLAMEKIKAETEKVSEKRQEPGGGGNAGLDCSKCGN